MLCAVLTGGVGCSSPAEPPPTIKTFEMPNITGLYWGAGRAAIAVARLDGHRAADRSELAILDAQTLQDVASITVPHRVPVAFHGNWIPTPAA